MSFDIDADVLLCLSPANPTAPAPSGAWPPRRPRCCAGPALLAALGIGALGTTMGAALGKPAVLIPAVLVLAVALALVIGRRRR